MVMDSDANEGSHKIFFFVTKEESRYGVTSDRLNDEDGVSVTAPDVFCCVCALVMLLFFSNCTG